MLACHMDNWEWLGAALALNGFPLSAVEKPQPNRVYSDFMNELRKGVGQEIFSRGTSEILGCARAMKKGRMLGLIADQDGGYDGIFVPFLGKMASTPNGPAYFSRKFKAPIVPIFIVRKPDGYGHKAIVRDPIHYEFTGDQKLDDYNVTLKMTQEVEKIIKEFTVEEVVNDKAKNTAYLKGIKGKVYRADGSFIDISADKGSAGMKSNDFFLEGNIKAVLNTGGELYADKISWNQEKELIMATGHFKMHKDAYTATADSAVTTSAFKHIKLKGNAKVEKGGE